MKKIAKKKKKYERLFSISITLLTLSLSLLFIAMLDVIYNFYPGKPGSESITMNAVLSFISTAAFGFCTVRLLHKYSKILEQIKRYQKNIKNKFYNEI